uniref:Uncharacterized protein n=1 Tax=Cacopsylla melanoneura TaxID=428564 RepID=A0A8D8W1R9_9HEMI
MFRTRASFQLGLKSILYLFLALDFNEKVSSTPQFGFGCSFANDEYNYYTYLYRYKKTPPVWSQLPMKSYAVDNFENIEKPLKNLFSEASILNELSLFTDFVKEYYLLSPAPCYRDFKTIFNNYEVPFEPIKKYSDPKIPTRKIRDPASYLIQELRDLMENPIMEYISPYLVSAYIDPINFHFNDSARIAQNDSQNIGELLQKRVQDHLAAIINIIYSGNRTGYILIDPGYANGKKLYHPFIVHVMDDGKPPHGEFLAGSEHNNKIIEFSVGGSKDKSFILAKRKWSKTVRHVLYYADKAYCSFMEHTVKANLLRLNHGIIARVPHSQRQGYLTFNISPENKNETQDHNNWLIIREIGNTTSGEMKEEKLSFMNFSNPKLVNETIIPSIDKAFGISINITKFSVKLTTDQLQYIQTEFFGDSKLMSEFIELNKKYALDKEGQKSKKISGKRKRLGCF